jgi:hypothetical protein
MTDKESMKLALEALETLMIECGSIYEKAIAALKERLADPMREVQRLGQEIEQEPVAWINAEKRTFEWNGPVLWNTPTVAVLNKIPLYTHPPRHTWVGLTDEEQLDIFAQSVARKRSEYEHYKAIEQALKEKNQ